MLILIVDDDPDDVDVLREAIRETDASIFCLQASDGLEAMDLLGSEILALPDFIFLDINMPLMNGRACLSELKRIPRLSAIPVVMYSTTLDRGEIDSCQKMGASGFISKPGSYAELLSAVKSVLSRQYITGQVL